MPPLVRICEANRPSQRNNSHPYLLLCQISKKPSRRSNLQLSVKGTQFHLISHSISHWQHPLHHSFATIPDVTWDDVGALNELREQLSLCILVYSHNTLTPTYHNTNSRRLSLTGTHPQTPRISTDGPQCCHRSDTLWPSRMRKNPLSQSDSERSR